MASRTTPVPDYFTYIVQPKYTYIVQPKYTYIVQPKYTYIVKSKFDISDNIHYTFICDNFKCDNEKIENEYNYCDIDIKLYEKDITIANIIAELKKIYESEYKLIKCNKLNTSTPTTPASTTPAPSTPIPSTPAPTAPITPTPTTPGSITASTPTTPVPTPTTSTSISKPQNKISVMTYNVSWENVGYTINDKRKPASGTGTLQSCQNNDTCRDNVINTIKHELEYDIDFIGLQEASFKENQDINYIKTLFNLDKYGYDCIHYKSGLADIILIYKCKFNTPNVITGDIDTGRPFICAIFKTITIITVHNRNKNITDEVQQCINTISKKIEAYKSEIINNPIIIMGDFNSDQFTNLKLFNKDLIVDNTFKTKTCCISDTSGITINQHGKLSSSNTPVDNVITWADSTISTKLINKVPTTQNKLASDHLPVSSTITLPDAIF